MVLILLDFIIIPVGGERYATYVEPMIKIEYKDILPQACFDNSLTARWGYLPMKVKDYAFGTDRVFSLPEGAEAFGSDASVNFFYSTRAL